MMILKFTAKSRANRILKVFPPFSRQHQSSAVLCGSASDGQKFNLKKS